MDAVELPLPVDVAAAPKLMGSEGFSLIQNGFLLIILSPIFYFYFFSLCYFFVIALSMYGYVSLALGFGNLICDILLFVC